MPSLAEFTSLGLLIPTLRNRDATGVIGELSSALEREKLIPNLLGFYEAVLAREGMCGTATAPGWAIPHARIPGLERLVFALGKGPEPLPWFGSKRQAVRLVFLFAVPAEEPGTYLHVVSALARLSQNPERIESLLCAETPQDLMEVLSQVRTRETRPTPLRVQASAPGLP